MIAIDRASEPAFANAAPPQPRHADPSALIVWLNRVLEQRTFALPPPPNDPRGATIAALLDALSHEFSDYHDVVAGARDAGRRNADQLSRVVCSTRDQGELVRATAAATLEAETGAALVATAAAALRGFAQAATVAADDANVGLAEIGTALAELGSRLAEGNAPLVDMRRCTSGVADFLTTLARLSRHAQLLAVNASIEAAHLAEGGSRFGIVAQEVRKLSTSTRESKADVAKIVAELRESTAQVAAAADDSNRATEAAAGEIYGAGEALSQTGHSITEFERMVGTVADVAATQSSALQAVSVAVDAIAQHADEAAGASREAGKVDLDVLLDRAEKKAASWTLRTQSLSAIADDDAFARWIGALVAGADATAHAEVDDVPELRPLVAAIRTLLQRVHTDQRDVLGNVVQVAVAVSRNGYAWDSIARALEGVSSEIAIVCDTVAESAHGAHTSAELAAGMRGIVETIRAQYDGALSSLEGALARILQITGSVREIDGFVESMNAAAARADQIMTLIETLSSETDLLSLNAAIEAAHAGDQGRGFSVIAEEIRALARSTNESTVNVSELVCNISRISGNLQTSIGGAGASTIEVAASAERVRGAIALLRKAFESAMRHALEVATTAADQTSALDRVLENVNSSKSAIDATVTATTDTRRMELARLGSRAHGIAARRPIGTVVERVRAYGEKLCVELETTIEAALTQGKISVDRLFDLRYNAVAGTDIQSLTRLFDVSCVPTDGFTPPKFATPWDAAIDQAMIDVLEAAYDDAATFLPITIFVSDLNGFLYAYPRRKINAWTNDPSIDNAGNRIKRLFEDEYTLRVGRWGLGRNCEDLGPRCTYEAFRSAGCNLARTSARPWGAYVYARDTNLVCNEVVMALYARDMRHSTLRICYDSSLI